MVGSTHRAMDVVTNLTSIDRLARMSGKEPGRIPVVDENPMATSALPTADSYEFFSAWGKKSNWKNDVTVRRQVYWLRLMF